MPNTKRLLATLKRLLKTRGLTYRAVADALHLSEPSIKRIFSNGNLSLDRLMQMVELTGLSFFEVVQEMEKDEPALHYLTEEQERGLISDEKLLLVAVYALNHWTLEQIIQAYCLTKTECLQKLLHLDKLRLIDLLPGDRIRLRVARHFAWQPNGPIQNFFHKQGLVDFMNGTFDRREEFFQFSHGMLTHSAIDEFNKKLSRLRQDFAELHNESLAAPFDQRVGAGVLCALRIWEPQGFEKLRRVIQ